MTIALMEQLLQRKSQPSSRTSEQKSPTILKSSSVTDAKAQGKIDDGLVQWVQDAYNRCRNQRAQYQKEWEYHLLMYSGEQFANLIASAGQIKKPNMPSSASKLVTNLLRPMVRQQIARMTSEKPTVTVVPVSASDDDLMAAQGGQAVFDSLYTNQKIQSKLIRTAFWTVITGNGFF